MSKTINIVLLSMALHVGLAAAGEPLTDGLADLKPEARVTAEQRKIPDANDVPAPAYPGSKLCFFRKGFANTVLLLSSAPYQQVKAWYKKRLRWTCASYNKKDEKFNCISGTDTLSIQKTRTSAACKMDGLQTLIAIQFM